jgi:hypothetical protein
MLNWERDGATAKRGAANADAAVDRVLAGLRGGAAPDGMEGRALRRLEECNRDGGIPGSGSPGAGRSGLSGWLWAQRGAVVAAALCVGLLLGVIAWRRHAGVSEASGIARVFAGRVATAGGTGNFGNALSQAARRDPAGKEERAGHGGEMTRQEAGLRQGAQALRGAGGDAARHGVMRPDASGFGEATERALLAGGHPAPPLPLTEQERLLLEVVHGRERGGDDGALAMLDRKEQEAALARSDAAFLRRFPPPPRTPPDLTEGGGNAAPSDTRDNGNDPSAQQAVQEDGQQNAQRDAKQIDGSGGTK